MSVPKSERKESRFEVQQHFYQLRKDITDLMMRQFGFSEEKYRKKIDRYKAINEFSANTEKAVKNFEKKNEAFNSWFIPQEIDTVSELLREIQTNFSLGNSIYPSEIPILRLVDFVKRRKYIQASIGYCYALKQEIDYIANTLPVDLNKFENFAISIDKQINLLKGVRSSDIKRFKNKANNSIENCIQNICKNIYDIFLKINSDI